MFLVTRESRKTHPWAQVRQTWPSERKAKSKANGQENDTEEAK
jgi:hypothetical protein